jgi:RND family efflux transporter MFP subunit
MKNYKLIFGVIIVAGITVGVLLNNKNKMQAKSRNDEIKFYPVTLIHVSVQKLSEELSLTGTISANNDVTVISETQGRVVRVLADVGSSVQAGEVIVQVDDELRQAGFATAEVNYLKSKKDLERYESVYKEGSVSDAQLEGARLGFKSAEAQYIVARRQLADTKIKSPISGIVTARYVNLGTMVMGVPQNTPIANVVDISKLKAKVNVGERDAFKLKVGERVSITTEVYPGTEFIGTIASISQKSDDAHTYPVEISLPNSAAHPLRAGMFARLSFDAQRDYESLFIPRAALIGSLKSAQVFVVENNIAKLRDIVVKGEVGSNLEVLSGIAVNDQLVVSGQSNLKDGVPVTVVK